MSGAVLPIIVLANSGSFETKTQCMSILQRMLLGRAMPEEVSRVPPVVELVVFVQNSYCLFESTWCTCVKQDHPAALGVSVYSIQAYSEKNGQLKCWSFQDL